MMECALSQGEMKLPGACKENFTERRNIKVKAESGSMPRAMYVE